MGEILDELLQWSRGFEETRLQHKAQRIYCRCMLKKKFKWAAAIKAKYKFPPPSDSSIAFGFTLMAMKEKK